MKKTVLLLGDITGRSRVAVRMLTAVLEERGAEVLALPTTLISNTLNLGAHAALDTTAYLLESIAVWEKLGLLWDAVHIGYIASRAQAAALCPIADAQREKGRLVVLDPILGDNGRRYNSVSDDQMEGMKLLMPHADLITPNLTEAALLCGVSYEEALGGAANGQMLRSLSGNGARSVLITSARTKAGAHAMVGFDAETKESFELLYEQLPGSRGGTGDFFSAILLQLLMVRMPLSDAAQFAGYAVEGELRKENSRILPDLSL
ncbi:MAG: bifunctional hydroxymethylpyrimidine kinase/phosphomethylpyrimidine kinase [Clostridia bacterium]|nr:bifunctional hydroxymethylpyrimidine kinase/phosphomethylpyrimidine kinase [Clostridia bacterium]